MKVKKYFNFILSVLFVCFQLQLIASVEKEVSFENINAKITLQGTLHLPDTINKHRAIILISGAGEQDRNASIGDYHFFKMLAESLVDSGFAVLRFDDRGVGASSGNHDHATTLDFAEDVQSAFDFLSSHDNIYSNKIGLVGHSEGGLIAPIVASKNKNIEFVVSLAGPGRKGFDVFQDQIKKVLIDNGISENIADIYTNIRGEIIQIYLNEEIQDKKKAASVSLMKQIQALDTNIAKQLPEIPLETWNSEFSKPWYGFFLNCNPLVYWEKVDSHVLLLNGENDLLVPYKENMTAIFKTVKTQHSLTYYSLPKTNHFFQLSTQLFDEKASLNDDLLYKIANWLNSLPEN
jgi:uncharacterized protein